MYQYSPNDVAVSLGAPIQGFAAGEFVLAEFVNDAFEMSSGSGGDTTRVKKLDRMGIITLTLIAESPSNDYLSDLAAIDRATSLGYQAFYMANLFGTTVVTAPQCWVKKPAPVGYGDTGANRVWVLETDELIVHVGGGVDSLG